MLHIYICKKQLSTKLPADTIYFDVPEEVSYTFKGKKYIIPLAKLTVAGWRALLHKGKRYVGDGSKTHKQAEAKVKRLQGEGKPPTPKGTRDVLAGYFAGFVHKRIRATGIKAKDIPKLGNTIAEITTSAKKHGLGDAWIKKALARSRKLEELEAADIE